MPQVPSYPALASLLPGDEAYIARPSEGTAGSHSFDLGASLGGLNTAVDANTTNIATNTADIATLQDDVVSLQGQIDDLALSSVYTNIPDALAGTTTGMFAAVAQATLYAIDTYSKVDGTTLVLADGVIRYMGAGIAAASKVEAQNAVIAALPAAPLYAVFGIDGKFNDQRFIPSRGTTPSRNMLQRPNFSQSVNNSAVITPGQPDPWGGNTAFRIQLPGGTAYATMFAFSNTITPTEAGDYRVGFMAKSNTGAGNQNFTLHKALATPLVTTAVTEGAWATGELILPGMLNTDYVTIYNPSGTTPLDLIIAPLSLSEQQVKLPAHPIPATGGVVGNRLSRAGTMTIDNKGNIVSPFKGRINFSDDGIAAQSFTAMTMWLTFKKTATSAAFNFNAPFWSRSSGNPDLLLGTEADLFSIKGPGMTSFFADPSWNAYGDGHLTLCIRFDATRTTASLGSIELATGTGTGGTPFTIPWAYFMGGFGDGAPFPGLVHSWGLFNSYLEDADLAEVVQAVNQFAADDGNALGAENIMFSAGDSITNGSGATASFGFMQQMVANLGLKRINEAVSGTAFVDMVTDPRNANFKRKISQCVADGKRAIVHCLIGTNAPQPTALQYQAQINAWKALGTADNPVIVVVGTIPDRTGRSPSVTAAYNTLIRGLTVDGLADYAANVHIGGAGAAADTTYFNVDGIHPNDTGHGIMLGIGQPVITGLLR